MNYDTSAFEHGLNQLHIELSENQMQQFLDYYELLIEWNKVMNLTGITEYEEVIQKHFLDSLCLVKAVTCKEEKSLQNQDSLNSDSQELSAKDSSEYFAGLKLLDLGTGAGFPGVPLKIAFPELNIVLADSLNKRIKFLDEVITRLDLKQITAVHGRAEELARKAEYRGQFDLCVSRAVSNLAVLTEYCLPFVKKGGHFVSYKSAEIDEELDSAKKAISVLGGKLENTIRYELPDSDQGRSLVVIRKALDTPKIYPRKAGTPAKSPIK